MKTTGFLLAALLPPSWFVTAALTVAVVVVTLICKGYALRFGNGLLELTPPGVNARKRGDAPSRPRTECRP